MSSLKFSRAKDMELAWVDGQIDIPEVPMEEEEEDKDGEVEGDGKSEEEQQRKIGMCIL